MSDALPPSTPYPTIARDSVIKAITLLENRLASKGYHIDMGAEIEYHRHVNPESKETALGRKLLEQRRPVPIAFTTGDPRPHFERSRIVSQHKIEERPDHFEIVLDHQFPYRSGSPALRLARSIEASRKAIGKHQTDENRIHFNAHDGELTNGLHLNFSIHKEGASVLTKSEATKFARDMLPFLEENMALMVPHPEALKRFHRRDTPNSFTQELGYYAVKTMAVRAHESKNEHYIENRLPSADTDPFLAVLATLCAIEQAIEQPKGIQSAIKRWAYKRKDPSIPNNAEKLAAPLQNGSRLSDQLNSLEEGLGNTIIEAALAQHGTTITNGNGHISSAPSRG